MDAVAAAMGRPDAQQQLAQLMDQLDELTEHNVVHTSIGWHPEEPEGASTSLFSLTVRPAEHPNMRLSVARTALAIARSTLWSTSTRRFLDLRSSIPCCLVAGFIDLPVGRQQVFQARIATSDPGGTHLFHLDLTSAATQHHEAYTDILEAVAHTLSFTDPSPKPPSPTPTSRILEVLL
ncbi:hypothetical protein ACU4GG_33120 [Streptomyces nojiriensis]